MLKSAKIWLSNPIFYVKNNWNLSQFYFHRKKQFRNTIDNLIFLNQIITKMMSNFSQLAITQFLKINEFAYVMLIFKQKCFYLSIPRLKTQQPVLPYPKEFFRKWIWPKIIVEILVEPNPHPGVTQPIRWLGGNIAKSNPVVSFLTVI